MLLSLILFVFLSMRTMRTDRRKGWVPLPRCWHLFGSIALSQMRGQLRLPLCDAAKYRNSPKGLCMQASINRRLVTKMWIGHMLIVQMLTSSTLQTEQHSFTKVPSCCCLWFFLFSCQWGLWGLTEERAEYLCQDVDTVLFGSIALSQMRGQLRLPLCDPAKYRNSPKGLCMQASINRALSDKDVNWPYAHSPDVDKFHPSNWATFFHKSPVMLLSLILFVFLSMRTMRTDRRKGWVPLPRCWHLFGSIALSQMRGQLRLPLCDAAKYRNSPKGLCMQASINRRLVTKMWIGHMLIVQMLTSSTLQTEQHSFTKVPSCCCLWFFLFSCQWGLWGLTEERAEYLCQDVDTVLFGSIALSQMRGQLRLPLCDPAKYRNSPKGLCMQASINRALSDKDVNWPYAHSPDVDKFHPSNWATFFHKSPVMLLSLILFVFLSMRTMRTERRKGWVPLPRCWHRPFRFNCT